MLTPARVWRDLPGRQRPVAVVAVLLVLFGIVWLVPAAGNATARAVSEQSWPSVTGEVISYETRTTRSARGRTSVLYHPVVRYSADGGLHEVTADGGVGEPPVVGSQVEVRVRPGDPADGRISGDAVNATIQQAVGAIVCLVLGIGMIVSLWVRVRSAQTRFDGSARPSGWPPPGWTQHPTARR